MPTCAHTSVDTPAIFLLREPVVLVTHGRGREVYGNSRKLFDRIQKLDTSIDRILQVRHEGRALAEESVEALNAFLATPKAWSFFRRAEIDGVRFGVVGDKWSWSALGKYLGWEWHL